MLRKRVCLGLVLFISLFVTACTGVSTTLPVVSPIATSDGAAIPSSQTSPLAAPTVLPNETPLESGTGAVTAELHRLDGTTMKGILIYAAFIENRDGVRLSAVDPLLDPKAETDAEGRFVIRNLKPGEYALATQSPVGIIMPHGPQGKAVLYQVEAGKTTDLGRLDVGYTYPDN